MSKRVPKRVLNMAKTPIPFLPNNVVGVVNKTFQNGKGDGT
jgi:hypothetical protein